MSDHTKSESRLIDTLQLLMNEKFHISNAEHEVMISCLRTRSTYDHSEFISRVEAYMVEWERRVNEKTLGGLQ